MKLLNILFILLLIIISCNNNRETNIKNEITDFQKAISLYNNGKYELALPFFSKGVSSNDSIKFPSYFYRANCYIELNKFENAKTDLFKILDSNYRTIDVCYNIGICYLGLFNNDSAISYLQKSYLLDTLNLNTKDLILQLKNNVE